MVCKSNTRNVKSILTVIPPMVPSGWTVASCMIDNLCCFKITQLDSGF